MHLHETGYAKINLALHVRRRRADGYHDIETLFAFAADGDILEAEPEDALSLRIGGPFADGLAGDDVGDNLVLRAARRLQVLLGVRRGATIRLDKRLPVASGIGGGSADAAATIRLLCRLWEAEPSEAALQALATELGADVPACLASCTVRGDGRGDALAAVEGSALHGAPLLLVNPCLPLSTGAIFADWDGVDRGALPEGDPLAVAQAGRNDLEPPARTLQPEIGAVLALLSAQAGVRLARMSGSGATCFALFEDEAARATAAASVRGVRPDYWCLETVLR